MIFAKNSPVESLAVCLAGGVNQLPANSVINDFIPCSRDFHPEDFVKEGEGAVFVISHRQLDQIFGKSAKGIQTLKNISNSHSRKLNKTIKI